MSYKILKQRANPEQVVLGAFLRHVTTFWSCTAHPFPWEKKTNTKSTRIYGQHVFKMINMIMVNQRQVRATTTLYFKTLGNKQSMRGLRIDVQTVETSVFFPLHVIKLITE